MGQIVRSPAGNNGPNPAREQQREQRECARAQERAQRAWEKEQQHRLREERDQHRHAERERRDRNMRARSFVRASFARNAVNVLTRQWREGSPLDRLAASILLQQTEGAFDYPEVLAVRELALRAFGRRLPPDQQRALDLARVGKAECDRQEALRPQRRFGFASGSGSGSGGGGDGGESSASGGRRHGWPGQRHDREPHHGGFVFRPPASGHGDLSRHRFLGPLEPAEVVRTSSGRNPSSQDRHSSIQGRYTDNQDQGQDPRQQKGKGKGKAQNEYPGFDASQARPERGTGGPPPPISHSAGRYLNQQEKDQAEAAAHRRNGLWSTGFRRHTPNERQQQQQPRWRQQAPPRQQPQHLQYRQPQQPQGGGGGLAVPMPGPAGPAIDNEGPHTPVPTPGGSPEQRPSRRLSLILRSSSLRSLMSSGRGRGGRGSRRGSVSQPSRQQHSEEEEEEQEQAQREENRQQREEDGQRETPLEPGPGSQAEYAPPAEAQDLEAEAEAQAQAQQPEPGPSRQPAQMRLVSQPGEPERWEAVGESADNMISVEQVERVNVNEGERSNAGQGQNQNQNQSQNQNQNRHRSRLWYRRNRNRDSPPPPLPPPPAPILGGATTSDDDGGGGRPMDRAGARRVLFSGLSDPPRRCPACDAPADQYWSLRATLGAGGPECRTRPRRTRDTWCNRCFGRKVRGQVDRVVGRVRRVKRRRKDGGGDGGGNGDGDGDGDGNGNENGNE